MNNTHCEHGDIEWCLYKVLMETQDPYFSGAYGDSSESSIWVQRGGKEEKDLLEQDQAMGPGPDDLIALTTVSYEKSVWLPPGKKPNEPMS